MTEDIERDDYTALVHSLAATLDLRGGLAEAVELVGYTALSNQIANLLDLDAGLQSALPAAPTQPSTARTRARTSAKPRAARQRLMAWCAALARIRALFGALDREGAIGRALILAHDRDLNLDLASALQVARTLASALDLDRTPVLDQARDLSSGLVRDLARALDSYYPLHRHHELDRPAVTARDLAQTLDLALGSVLDGDYAPGCVAAPDLDLSRDLASAVGSYHALLRALANYPALDRDRDLASDFVRYRDVAQDLARYLDHHSATPAAVDDEGPRSLPRRVQLAVWLLPRSWQPRYSEEFRAELARLSRGERNKYARRVLKEAWRLRKERPDRAADEGTDPARW